jgi:hypothetical protein
MPHFDAKMSFQSAGSLGVDSAIKRIIVSTYPDHDKDKFPGNDWKFLWHSTCIEFSR